MTPAPATAPLRIWPANRPVAQLLANWNAHWPIWVGTLGLLWLIASVLTAPLNEWMATYTAIWKANKPDTTLTIFDEIARGYEKGYKDSRSQNPMADMTELRVLWRLTWSLFIPLGLVLSGSGHYLYRYATRPTLFSDKPGRTLKSVLVVSVIWVVWTSLVSTGIMQFSAQSHAFGFDLALPTVMLGFWLIQGATIHFFVRQREQRTLTQTARKAELAALTAQVNPPFIFHALQHLQATAHAEHLPRTEQSLTQLAGIMQYVLEESRKKITDVSREIDFIRDYLRLQELRLPRRDTIQIRTTVEWDGKPTPIVPLLLNPLIENAFKYGISIQQACFVTIQLRIADGVLTFSSENSVLPRTDLERGTGLGLSNVRKRLQLAYPALHKLTITEQSGTYQVSLKIKLC